MEKFAPIVTTEAWPLEANLAVELTTRVPDWRARFPTSLELSGVVQTEWSPTKTELAPLMIPWRLELLMSWMLAIELASTRMSPFRMELLAVRATMEGWVAA